MPRRRLELDAYLNRWLPELREAEPGLCIDIGPGPGDLLWLLKSMGHETMGIDAPDGRGGMGDAYVELSKEYCRNFKVDVDRSGLMATLKSGATARWSNRCVLVNARGSIEQALNCMTGDPHDLHHDAKRLDWDRDAGPIELDRFMAAVHAMLRPGGILLIAANGSQSDGWYDNAIRIASECHGLELVEQEGLLTHKWRKP